MFCSLSAFLTHEPFRLVESRASIHRELPSHRVAATNATEDLVGLALVNAIVTKIAKSGEKEAEKILDLNFL